MVGLKVDIPTLSRGHITIRSGFSRPEKGRREKLERFFMNCHTQYLVRITQPSVAQRNCMYYCSPFFCGIFTKELVDTTPE